MVTKKVIWNASTRWIAVLLLAVVLAPDLQAGASCSPWVTSDAKLYGQDVPNAYSLEAFHNSPVFKDLAPKEFCRKLFDVYYDGRRKSYGAFKVGMTLWSHTPQEPRASKGLIEHDPILLLNVHGSGYCGIQSGLLEGIYQTRPGGEPGKPAIDARRWFIRDPVHSVADAYYDGKWHYYDIDLGGYAGDAEKDVWSVADVLNDPQGYYGKKTTIKSKYFFKADRNGAWVKTLKKKGSYCFQDNLMVGHEMALPLRKGERITRWFSKAAAGWSELPPLTKKINVAMKGFCEVVYEPTDTSGAIAVQDGAPIFSIRCPYNITSSKVEAEGKATYSTDLGVNWKPLPADGLVPEAINHWDYLLKVEGGKLKKVTTRGLVHPASLPIVGKAATKMTVAQMADYQVLTWIPDWSTPEAAAKTAKWDKTLKFKKTKAVTLTGGGFVGRGTLTIPVKAPAGCKIVKLAATILGGAATQADANRYLEVHLGPKGASKLVQRSTDCSTWGKGPVAKVEHWQQNVNGSAGIDACDEAEVKIVVNGWGRLNSARVYVGFQSEKQAAPGGNLVITHGFDGTTFEKSVPVADLMKAPVTYTVEKGAKKNEFIRMETK